MRFDFVVKRAKYFGLHHYHEDKVQKSVLKSRSSNMDQNEKLNLVIGIGN